jgi:hypothetical protein
MKFIVVFLGMQLFQFWFYFLNIGVNFIYVDLVLTVSAVYLKGKQDILICYFQHEGLF